MLLYKAIIWLRKKVIIFITKIYVLIIFKVFSIKHYSDYKIYGLPIIKVGNKGSLSIGHKFKMNSGYYFNQIGRQQKSILIANGDLIIKDRVGISSTAIICQKRIEIGNDVKIGGNTVIYDTDFHSLNFYIRRNFSDDVLNANSSEVKVEDDVFIGAHSIILKGVTIGKSTIIAAGSVVSKSIPPFEIWGGNPAKFIKKVDNISES